jgi:AAA family ATP:ADP antiporter
LFFNVFLLLLSYYVLKTVREPLILMAGGAELKSYAAAAQALTLIVYVPVYGWVATKLPRQQFLMAVILFFIGCIQLFFFGSKIGIPHLGFIFFVWVGIFSLTKITQFWSYANEIYAKADGDRLSINRHWFSGRAPWGGTSSLFGFHLSPFLMEIAAAILLLPAIALLARVATSAEST